VTENERALLDEIVSKKDATPVLLSNILCHWSRGKMQKFCDNLAKRCGYYRSKQGEQENKEGSCKWEYEPEIEKRLIEYCVKNSHTVADFVNMVLIRELERLEREEDK